MPPVPPYTSTTDYSSMVTDAERLFDELKKITAIDADINRITKSISGEYNQMVKAADKLRDAEEKTRAINAVKESQQQRLNKLKELQSTLEQLTAVNTALSLTGAAALTGEAVSFNQQQKATLTNNRLLLQSQLGITDAIANSSIDLENLKNKYKEILKSLEEKNKKEEMSKKSIQDFFQGIKLISNEITGITSDIFTFSGILTNIIKKFNEIEDAAFEIRKTMGLIVGDDGAERFYKLVAETSVALSRIGATAKDVGESVNSISKTFGSSMFATEEIVSNFTAISVGLGIAADTSAKALKNIMGISQSSADSNKSMAGFAKILSEAAEVPLAEVMNDLANISESVRSTFRGSSIELIKTTVQARKLGLTLEQTGAIAEKLLNFTESINAEIEASVLLGKNISFNDARSLAYRGEIGKATKSVLDTVKKTADINKLDYFTLKSIAEATGLNVGQLQDTIQIEKDLSMLRFSGNEEQRKLVDKYEELNNLSASATKTEADAAMERIKNTNNLAQQKQILSEIQAIFYQIAETILPMIRGVGKLVKFFGDLNKETNGALGIMTLATIAIVKFGLAGKIAAGGIVSTIAAGIISISTSMATAVTTLGTAGVAVTALSEVLIPAAIILAAFGLSVLMVGGGIYFMARGVDILVGSFGKLVEIFNSLTEDQLDKIASGILKISTSMAMVGGLGIMSILGFGAFIGQLYALSKVADPLSKSISLLSDSFAKFVENFNDNNIITLERGIVSAKKSMSELREELRNFSDKDLNVLDNLGKIKSKITTNAEIESNKKSETTALAESIKSAVIDGMRQVKINITLDGRSVGTGIATAMSIAQPAGIFDIVTKQQS